MPFFSHKNHSARSVVIAVMAPSTAEPNNINADPENALENRADKSAKTPSNGASDRMAAEGAADVQDGVKKIEATAKTWTHAQLVLAYVLYVSLPVLSHSCFSLLC